MATGKGLIRGTVDINGEQLQWKAGPRERIKAERALGIKLTKLEEQFTEEYIAYLAYASLAHQGHRAASGTFDEFLEQLDDYDLSEGDDPESQTPPGE